MKNYYKVVLKKSILLLTLSFGLLFAVATTLVWKYDLSIWYGVAISVGIVLVQFLFGPIFIDLIYKVKFNIEHEYINENVLNFIKTSCEQYNIPAPKIGIIKDGNPNAFTYGHIPRNARLVVTTGLLDILEEEEKKAVIAHELGHIKHYDFIAMMVVSLIPMILYQVYVGTKGKKSDKKYIIALGAYAAYLLSGFLVLGFSRMREYYSDNFAKELMGESKYLKNALIKIAYGTASREKGENPRTSCMAFTNNIQNDALMLSTYKLDGENKLDEKLIRWDLKNPWAKWYEINSTHPLTGRRILALTDTEIVETEDSEGWIKRLSVFIVEAIINMLPATMALAGFMYLIFNKEIGISYFIKEHSLYIALIGASILIKYYYSYRKNYEERSIKELLEREDASPVRGIPTVLKGKVIGKGIPGLFYSEDLVIDDGTGIMLVDYRQPLKIFEWIFGLFEVDKYIDREVEIIGWYKRSVRPYFVCKYIVLGEEKAQCFNYILIKICGYLLMALGIYLKFIYY
ncbi:M48 family metalloprotease [Clostridium sp. MSJ-11]|uniref:M48 family metalloprotease n=1 Tax=Clostridium mobile TaxID=2841512 RepID=A0ABS6EGT3_9CLOT|nr:M48 family metalloprotease [Clostridium mobile]